MRTQIGIVGAGPAGLMLSHLLHLNGIESIVIENRSREYVERRVRAGVLEQNTVDLLISTGVGERLKRQGLVHHGIELCFLGKRHRINFDELTNGRTITIYGQNEVVKDLTDARLAAGGQILFEVSNVSISLEPRPSIHFIKDDQEFTIICDFIAGCDGFHGVCRKSIPPDKLTVYERVYPFAWLGILAQTPPSTDEIVYCYHERGFALHSMRSPQLSRLYLQCPANDSLDNWPDDRIWSEIKIRSRTDEQWDITPGPIIQRGITELRSFVVEPMQYGRLFLAGDAAHIVPATGAKGLNLAIADVYVLSQILTQYYRTGRSDLLGRYSEFCLDRVWKVQRFSWWMTSMLHRFDDDKPFDHRRRLAELEYVVSSRAAAQSLAENYVGLPLNPIIRA